MKPQIALLAISFAVALGFSIAVAFLTDNTPFEFANVIIVPGMLAAALVFPQGVESDHGSAYLAIAGLITAMLLTWPILKLGQLFVYCGDVRELQRAEIGLGGNWEFAGHLYLKSRISCAKT